MVAIGGERVPATGQARNGVERVHRRALGPDDHSEAVGLVTQGVLELPIYRWLFGIKGHWDLLSERSARWTAELMCEWLRQGGGGIGAFDADNRLVGLILLTLPGQPVPTMTEDQVAYLTELVRADPDVGRRLVKMRGGGDADLSRADAIDVAHAVVDPRVRKSGILRKLAIAVNELALELARRLRSRRMFRGWPRRIAAASSLSIRVVMSMPAAPRLGCSAKRSLICPRRWRGCVWVAESAPTNGEVGPTPGPASTFVYWARLSVRLGAGADEPASRAPVTMSPTTLPTALPI